MELKLVIESRTSIRNFLPDPVPVEDIKEMVRLAGLAPSVNNFQPWKFILIRDKELLSQMAERVAARLEEFPIRNSEVSRNINNQVAWYSTFFKDAPAVIGVILTEYETVWEKGIDLSTSEINQIRNHPDIQSAGACIQNLLLAATDMGYGGCWLSSPMVARKDLESLLKIHQPDWLLSFVAIGKPVKGQTPKTKENLGNKLLIL
jgi:nitroreductase